MATTIHNHTTYGVDFEGREYELLFDPSCDDPVIQKLADGRVVIGYLSHDPDPQNPRENDNLGVMACWHRRYNLEIGRAHV